jgi:hypothetical protein
MAVPPQDGHQFPDDGEAGSFVIEYPAAVAPFDPAKLATRPPLLLLRIPAGVSYEHARNRVLEALRQPLNDDHDGRLVPHAVLYAGETPALLSEAAGEALQRSVPRRQTPDRFPHFNLMLSLVTHVREHPNQRPRQNAERLRAYACDQQADDRRGLLGHLPRTSPPETDLKGWLLKIFWLSFTRYLPRWAWSRWMSRKVMRRWFTALRVTPGGRDLYRAMDDLAATQATRMQLPPEDPDHEKALETFERLLVRALLEDLGTPPVGRCLPRRRRRVTRPVLLVEVPPPGSSGSRRAERFLRAVHEVRGGAPRSGPLVVAVGQPSQKLLEDLGLRVDGRDAESSLAQAGRALSGTDGDPVLATFSENSLNRPGGLHIVQAGPHRRFRTSWRTTTSLFATATALAVVAGGIVTYRVVNGGDHSCVGGTASVASAARSGPVPLDAKGWYDAAVGEITKQNRRAENYAAQGRTVRTVVAFVSSRPRNEDETRFDGTIPELRGIAMWQRKLNDDAASNESLVPLRVDVRPTGEGFRNAVAEARRLVGQVRDERGVRPYERVVGVLAYAQSRDETRDALHVLGAAEIPTVGTTATADEMLSGSASLSYWPFTPSNSREAGIEAYFASHENIVARRGDEGSCSPARRALVIESSADLYSRSLASRFVKEFPGRTQVFNFNQDGDFGHQPAGAPNLSSADVLAERLCQTLEEEPDSVVYWSARAKDFTAFITAMDTQGTCIGHDVTVLGGNELTNVAQTGAFADKDWLRLYYSAHRLPVTDPAASAKTRQFVAAYEAFVRSTTKGIDPWRQDGHSAVSYDAFHVLSQAVAEAWLRDRDVSRRSVLIALGGGVAFDGATGYVSYDQGGNAPPVDKTLVLLRQLGNRPEAVLVCGAYTEGALSQPQSAPCRT